MLGMYGMHVRRVGPWYIYTIYVHIPCTYTMYISMYVIYVRGICTSSMVRVVCTHSNKLVVRHFDDVADDDILPPLLLERAVSQHIGDPVVD